VYRIAKTNQISLNFHEIKLVCPKLRESEAKRIAMIVICENIRKKATPRLIFCKNAKNLTERFLSCRSFDIQNIGRSNKLPQCHWPWLLFATSHDTIYCNTVHVAAGTAQLCSYGVTYFFFVSVAPLFIYNVFFPEHS
jgi:hypothetical protein